MRRLLVVVGLLLAIAAPSASADDFPAPVGFLVDQAGVVPAAQEARLETQLQDYARRTTNQIGVAVVQSIGDRSIEDYSRELFNRWGVGQSGANNGVLLVIAVRDHADRIEVGSGLTGQLSDAESASILAADVTPYARKGDFAGAIAHTVAAIQANLGEATSQGPPFPVDATPAFGGGSAPGPTYQDPSRSGHGGFVFGGFGLFVLIIGARVLFGGMGGMGGYRGGYMRSPGMGLGAGLLFGSMMNQGRRSYSGGQSSGFGGLSGGGGSWGGGGGGFGGGSSGGGGASGGW